ncbi:MAG: hypothetical protein Q7T74_06215 [Candidatus Saccharibacteria bacterium]|nr:hypothetical protein [Candidatus Saccharibacteria bacterium]
MINIRRAKSTGSLASSRILFCGTLNFLLTYALLIFSYKANAQTYPVPSVVSPLSGAIIVQTGQNPCFSWSRVSDSRFKSYVVTVSLSTNFPNQRWAYDVTSAATTSVCWNGGSGWSPKGTNLLPLSDAMKPGITYYWRVLATYNDGSTVIGTDVTGIPFSVVRPTPSPIAPENGATVTYSAQNPCFSWSMPSNSQFSYYTITLSTTTNFPVTRWAYQINSIATTSLCWNNGAGWESKGTTPPPTPGPLQNGVTYYWRVLASYTDGSLTGNTFAGRSFVYRASSSSSSPGSSSRSSGSSAAIQSKTIRYSYDALGRLTFVEDSQNGNRDYDYDKAGNRLLVSTKVASDKTAEPNVSLP